MDPSKASNQLTLRSLNNIHRVLPAAQLALDHQVVALSVPRILAKLLIFADVVPDVIGLAYKKKSLKLVACLVYYMTYRSCCIEASESTRS